jgi:hypothetical protein
MGHPNGQPGSRKNDGKSPLRRFISQHPAAGQFTARNIYNSQ